MKKQFLILLTLFSVGLSQLGFASGYYYPPERIRCSLDQMNQLRCEEFNRQYLTEYTTNANLQQHKNQTFQFSSAAAFFGAHQEEVTVFFRYQDAQGKIVKLKTTNPLIRPDLKNPAWTKFNNDFYTCRASYMVCGIMLPA